MLLTIDIGNTNTVLGVFEGDQVIEHWRIATDPGGPPTSSPWCCRACSPRAPC